MAKAGAQVTTLGLNGVMIPVLYQSFEGDDGVTVEAKAPRVGSTFTAPRIAAQAKSPKITGSTVEEP